MNFIVKRKRRATWLAIFVAMMTAPAATHAAGILKIGAAVGLPGCKVFFMPNGRQWRARGHDISAGGKCPADFMSGSLIARNQVRLGNGETCTFDDTGNGTCR